MKIMKDKNNKEIKKYTSLNRNTWQETAFLAPQLFLYVLFTILPFIIAVPIMLTSQVNFLDANVSFVGLDNVKAIFTDPLVSEYLPALKITAKFTFFNYLTVFLVGLPLALIMYEMSSKLRNVFFVIIYMPYIVALFGIGMMLTMLLSPDSGSLNFLLIELGILNKPINIMDEKVAAIALPIIAGWKNAGFNMALFLSGLLTIPHDTIEASVIDGATYFQRLRRIYFPQMIPSFVIATIMCLLGSFGSFDLPVGFGGLRGNRSAMFLSVLLFKMGFSGGANQSGTLAQAVTMSIVTYIPLLVFAVLLNKYQKNKGI